MQLGWPELLSCQIPIMFYINLVSLSLPIQGNEHLDTVRPYAWELRLGTNFKMAICDVDSSG